MASSWEYREANKVLCCILHTDTTTIAWSFGLRNLKIPGRDDLRKFSPFLPLAGMPFDMARNAGVQAALNLGAEYVFMYDSDVVPPHDAIIRLMRHNLPFISGMYCRRSPPHAIPVMIKGTWVTDFPRGKLIEVDMVGAGCLLIHRSVFETLPHQRLGHPWFDWRVNMQGILPPQECLSEDFTLCMHYKKHGGHVYVDTSVKCRHIGYAEAGDGTFVPLNTTPNT